MEFHAAQLLDDQQRRNLSPLGGLAPGKIVSGIKSRERPAERDRRVSRPASRQIEHRWNPHTPADQDCNMIHCRKTKRFPSGPIRLHAIATLQCAQPRRPDSHDAMDDLQLHPAPVCPISPPARTAARRHAPRSAHRAVTSTAATRRRIPFSIRLVVPIAIATLELNELPGLGGWELIQMQDQPVMFAADRDVFGNGRDELATRLRRHAQGGGGSKKKTSGGVAPIHLRKCRPTARSRCLVGCFAFESCCPRHFGPRGRHRL